MSRLKPNPFGDFRLECESALKVATGELYPHLDLSKLMLTPPPSPQYGDLASSLCFELARQVKEIPQSLAERLAEKIPIGRFELLSKVEALNGYLNFYVDYGRLSRETAEAVESYGANYGLIKADKPEKIIVEHTSANPSGSLHAGTARNAILGDALATILERRGHQVRRHFYIDDVGRQVATVAYGYRLIGEPAITGKPDRWIGFLYTATNCAINLRTLKEKVMDLQRTGSEGEDQERSRRQLDEYVGIAAEVEQQNKDGFQKILEGVNAEENPELSIGRLLMLYEVGDPEAKRLIRKIVEGCLRGFRETLDIAGINFDSWDWESDLVWSGDVKGVVQKLTETPFTVRREGALALDADLAAEKLGIKDKLVGGFSYGVPPLTLTRTDGTTLYTTRDIAYHLRKFAWADKAVNVIGVDQRLAQIQLKIALHILGVKGVMDNLIHYAYELVKLPGYKMSRRKGRLVTLDEMMEEAQSIAYEEVTKKNPNLTEEEKRGISKIVGIGAVKYAMLSISALKTVTFTWDKVINFEVNSGPFIQYAHARACSILRKAEFKPTQPDFSLLEHPLERRLVLKLARFPEVFIEAADSLRPEVLSEYANEVSDAFNAFYDALSVIHAEAVGLRDARMRLVEATRTVLSNALGLLGIEAPEKM